MMADTNNAATSTTTQTAQSSTGGGSVPAQPNATQATQGSGYSVQAADAGADERPGADGGRGSPNHEPTDDMTAEDLRAMVKALRAEAAAGRKAKQELDEHKRQLEDAKLSETEKLQKQLADYQQQIEALNLAKQEIALRARVESVAATLGLKPELALRIIDQNAVAFDDNGFPTNISDLLERAMQDYGLAPLPTSAATSSPASPNTSPAVAAAQPGRYAPPAGPSAPQTGATNPPRSGGMAAANGVFGPGERPRLNDRRLWSGPHNPNNPQRRG